MELSGSAASEGTSDWTASTEVAWTTVTGLKPNTTYLVEGDVAVQASASHTGSTAARVAYYLGAGGEVGQNALVGTSDEVTAEGGCGGAEDGGRSEALFTTAEAQTDAAIAVNAVIQGDESVKVNHISMREMRTVRCGLTNSNSKWPSGKGGGEHGSGGKGSGEHGSGGKGGGEHGSSEQQRARQQRARQQRARQQRARQQRARQQRSEHGSSEHGSSEHGSSEHGSSEHGSSEHGSSEGTENSEETTSTPEDTTNRGPGSGEVTITVGGGQTPSAPDPGARDSAKVEITTPGAKTPPASTPGGTGAKVNAGGTSIDRKPGSSLLPFAAVAGGVAAAGAGLMLVRRRQN
ncbi:hypothetical protein [Xylanimonas allomyrinae]|uniref:hypothetical protein n=1 Tax=Xylanimonas allomyrinae TaxID=2509459 RepID=UPI0013A5F92A|nr:hypothetical protein [Xylanimonas allomyrinae]